MHATQLGSEMPPFCGGVRPHKSHPVAQPPPPPLGSDFSQAGQSGTLDCLCSTSSIDFAGGSAGSRVGHRPRIMCDGASDLQPQLVDSRQFARLPAIAVKSRLGLAQHSIQARTNRTRTRNCAKAVRHDCPRAAKKTERALTWHTSPHESQLAPCHPPAHLHAQVLSVDAPFCTGVRACVRVCVCD